MIFKNGLMFSKKHLVVFSETPYFSQKRSILARFVNKNQQKQGYFTSYPGKTSFRKADN